MEVLLSVEFGVLGHRLELKRYPGVDNIVVKLIEAGPGRPRVGSAVANCDTAEFLRVAALIQKAAHQLSRHHPS